MTRLNLLALGVLTIALGCSDSVRPLFVDGIRVEPDSAHLTVGEGITLEGLPVDARGNPLPERGAYIDWRVSQPGILTLSDSAGPSVTVSAAALGSSSVEVEIGRGRQLVPVYVFPEGLSDLGIEPSQIRLSVGQALDVRGRLFSANGEALDPSGFRLSWGFDADAVALLTAGQTTQARLFGRASGTGRLTFVVNNRRVTVEVIVN